MGGEAWLGTSVKVALCGDEVGEEQVLAIVDET